MQRVRKLAVALGMTVLLGMVLVGTVEANAVSAAASSQLAPSRDWRPPLAGTLSVQAGFAPPPKPWQPGHRGVDLAASSGTPVLAAGAGVVTYAGRLAGRGVITVTHGSLRTTYEPVEPIVAPGTSVSAGQQIGTLGAGGHCGGHCLHWGLLRADEYLNPLALLQMGPPVLKPLAGSTAQPAERAVVESGPGVQTRTASDDIGVREEVGRGVPGSAIAGGLALGLAASVAAIQSRRGAGRS